MPCGRHPGGFVSLRSHRTALRHPATRLTLRDSVSRLRLPCRAVSFCGFVQTSAGAESWKHLCYATASPAIPGRPMPPFGCSRRHPEIHGAPAGRYSPKSMPAPTPQGLPWISSGGNRGPRISRPAAKAARRHDIRARPCSVRERLAPRFSGLTISRGGILRSLRKGIEPCRSRRRRRSLPSRFRLPQYSRRSALASPQRAAQRGQNACWNAFRVPRFPSSADPIEIRIKNRGLRAVETPRICQLLLYCKVIRIAARVRRQCPNCHGLSRVILSEYYLEINSFKDEAGEA